MMDLMNRYSDYYKPLLQQFCKDITAKLPAEEFHGIPHPFIPAWGSSYEMSGVKMAIIGKETRGWAPCLPDYISEVQQGRWESSFDISEFQNLDYVDWNNGHRHTFFGFVMYFLAALYGVKNWELLKQRHFPNILNSFVWGNVCAIESWGSDGIPGDTNPVAHQCARDAAYILNDYCHVQKLFSPDVAIIMCARQECNSYLRNTKKTLVWDRDGVRLWQLSEGGFVFNMPHPNNMRWNLGADFYAQTIRRSLIENKLFQPLPEFLDCDKESEAILNLFFAQCTKNAHNTKEAVAFIATELRKQQATMTVRMLCDILNKLGYRTTYESQYLGGRGSYKMVAGAWSHYQEHLKQPAIAESIALAFTRPNGEYAYE